MNELMIIVFCVWYMLMGFGSSKLIRSNNLGANRDVPMFFTLLGWWLVVPVCALCKEGE